MDIAEIRRANIELLIADYGLEQQDFASKVETTESYVSLIVNGKRNCGNPLARRIEVAFARRRGWLDQHHPLDQETEMYISTFLSLPAPLRKEAIRQLNALAELAKMFPSQDFPEEGQKPATKNVEKPQDEG